MFYFLLSPYLIYHRTLIAAAVIPAVFLMIKVYRSDKLEKESPYMIWHLVRAGILSALLALVIPALLHGTYDYIGTMETDEGSGYFIGFVLVLFVVSFFLVGKTAKEDQLIA